MNLELKGMFDFMSKLPKVKNEGMMNSSFNLSKINDPRTCGFYSAEIGTDFFLSNQAFTLENFFLYHDEWLKRRNVELKTFLRSRVNAWKDTRFTEKEKIRYIFDVFFRRTFNGLLKEKAFYDFLKNKCSIRHATNQEDLRKHFDFSIDKVDRTHFYVQLKPLSFLEGRKKPYIKSAINEMVKKQLPIFIVVYKNDRFFLIIRDKEKGGVKTIPFMEFFNTSLTQRELDYLAMKILNSLSD